jgi:branched-chain amino acid transport system substrate-binding protein
MVLGEQKMSGPTRRVALGAATLAAAGTLAPPRRARAQATRTPLRIGVLTDMSGIFSDLSGRGAVEAVRMAVEDHGGKVLDRPIEVLFADHQNKPDVGAARGREWFDGGVSLIVDLANSSVALALAALAREKKRHIIVNGASNMGITNQLCSPYAVHYAYDAFSLANGTGRTIVEQGGDSWYFVTVDFAFGHGLEQQVGDVVRAAGGRVVGASRHPLNTTDFSSFMLQAQASRAKIIGIASTGADAVNAIKAAREFGNTRTQKIAALLLWDNDVHALGLETAQGLLLTNAWYWDMNERSRAFGQRFFERVGRMPNMSQAGDYSSTRHYLRAVEAAGSDDADAVSVKMRELRINDMFTADGFIREDGRMVHDMYLWEVKKPVESNGAWDLLKPVRTIPAADAFQPLALSSCPLVRKT